MDSEKVYVNEGLNENEKLVVTDIAAPVEDMLLRVAGAGDENKGPDKSQEGKRPMARQSKGQEPTKGESR